MNIASKIIFVPLTVFVAVSAVWGMDEQQKERRHLNSALIAALDGDDLMLPGFAKARRLLRAGADINATFTYCMPRMSGYERLEEWTPLHLCVCRGRDRAIRFLINHGADIDACACRHLAPLHVAARNRFMFIYNPGGIVNMKVPVPHASEVVRVLLAAGAELSDDEPSSKRGRFATGW